LAAAEPGRRVGRCRCRHLQLPHHRRQRRRASNRLLRPLRLRPHSGLHHLSAADDVGHRAVERGRRAGLDKARRGELARRLPTDSGLGQRRLRCRRHGAGVRRGRGRLADARASDGVEQRRPGQLERSARRRLQPRWSRPRRTRTRSPATW
jgi:hypothetical protein